MVMSKGKMGVVVLILALVGTLMGSWIMSMDVEETEVVRFNELTPIDGLFQSQNTPTFTDYSPAANYTGYYTTDSVIDGINYFDGVDFVDSTKPNNYKLQEKPIVSGQIREDTPYTTTSGETIRVEYNLDNTPQGYQHKSARIIHLSEFTPFLNYGQLQQATTIKITNVNTPNYDTVPVNWASFVTSNMIIDYLGNNVVALNNPNITNPYNADWLTSYNPIMALEYNSRTGIINLYYDAAMTEYAGSSYIADTYLMFSTSDQSNRFTDYQIPLLIDYQTLPDPEYMDPSKGVELA